MTFGKHVPGQGPVPAANAFAGTGREVLRLGFDTFPPGVREIGFNPTAGAGDGDRTLLYLALGDIEETPNFAAGPRNLGVPQSKILRIDPAGTGGSGGGCREASPHRAPLS